MNVFLRRTVVGLVLVTSSFGIAGCLAEDAILEAPTDGITAKDILTHVADVYKTCKSYCDSGESKTVFVRPGPKYGCRSDITAKTVINI